MQAEINGAVHEVASGRDALASVGPHDEVIVAHRRADGAVLQVGGSAVSGFVVEVDGGHTGRRTSASRTIPSSTIAVMLDRFAAGDTGWPGATIWYDETVRRTPRRRSPVPTVILFVVAAAVAVAAVLTVRRFVTVPWLCGRGGGDVDRVRLIGDGVIDQCVFVDGSEASAVDLTGALWLAEVAAAVVVLWLVVVRIGRRVIGR